MASTNSTEPPKYAKMCAYVTLRIIAVDKLAIEINNLQIPQSME